MGTRRHNRIFCSAAASGGMAASSGANGAGAAQRPSALSGAGSGAGYFRRHFGIDDDLLRGVMREALSRGGDYADLYFQHRVSDFIGFEDGQVNRAAVSMSLGCGVRVLKGDQSGFAFTEELTRASLLRAAKTAATIADDAPTAAPNAWRPVAVPDLYAAQPVWVSVAPAEKLRIAERVGQQMNALDARVLRATVQLGCEDEAFLVACSDGALAEDVRPMTYIYAGCTAAQGDRVESGMYSRSARSDISYYSDAFLQHVAHEAVQRTVALFDARVPAAGEMPVVLAPASSGILLHEAMGHGFEADFNRKGTSIFADMMHQRVAPPFVHITDTGLLPQARGAIHVDDEGIPSQRTPLVEDGILVSYLHDRLSARHYGVSPTGNGRRESFRTMPLPRMRITLMENGPHDPAEIIRSVKRGLYAVDFSNGQVAIGAGDYSFYVKNGFLIEDGRLCAPVKDVNLIGNGPQTMQRIEMVGNDMAIDGGSWTCGKDGQSVPVGLGLPTIKVSAITVGGVNT